MLGTCGGFSSATRCRPSSREQLTAWLLANKTGAKRLRAGLRANWRVGDKTGAGGNGAANDIAVVWPPGRAPTWPRSISPVRRSDEARNGVIADAGSDRCSEPRLVLIG